MLKLVMKKLLGIGAVFAVSAVLLFSGALERAGIISEARAQPPDYCSTCLYWCAVLCGGYDEYCYPPCVAWCADTCGW